MSHDASFAQCRSLAWHRMAESTPLGGLALPCCAQCGHQFYPPQRYCPRCLHGHIDYVADSGAAVVLSVTRLHHTLEPAFVSLLPLHVAAVRTDSDVTLFALADDMLAPGTRVRVSLSRDGSAPADVLRVRALPLPEHGGAA
ncbi:MULTISPECIES: Zn-ribbon domain-containing OB-fold protein [Paraburkholderia]|uniref:Zinc ribbon domain-containing protein n=1 Tax=Paraburkholderia unamae TaxID=219649 RepID=A0ACC6RSE0_9BURK